MQPLNKYNKDLKHVKEGQYVTDGKGKEGIVKHIETKSLAWGILYTFTLENGKKIIVED